MNKKELEAVIEKRVSGARRFLVARATHLASLVIKADHVADANLPHPAATDGNTIFYGPSFAFDFTPQEQVFIVLHEVMHMALGHAQLTKKLQNRGTPWSHDLSNIIADCFINDCLATWKPCVVSVPKGALDLEKLHELVEELCPIPIADAQKSGLHLDNGIFIPASLFKRDYWRFSMVDVHDYLVHLALQKHGQNLEGGGVGGGLKAGDNEGGQKRISIQHGQAGAEEGGSIPEVEDEAKKVVGNGGGFGENGGGRDLLIPQNKGGETDSDAEKRADASAREWGAALRQAARQPGSHPGSGLLQLVDAARPIPPWYMLVRSILERHLVPGREEMPTLPSNNTMVLHAAGLPYSFEPAYSNMKRGGVLCVCVDTSASISDDDLFSMGQECIAVARVMNAPMHIITCDTQVHDVYENVEDAEMLRGGLQFHGRGGTTFEPAFEKAEEYNPRAVVYLTDGYAAFPEQKPKGVVVWVITPGGLPSDQFPDWGYKVRVDPKDQ